MDLSNEAIIHVKTPKVEYIQFRKLLEYKDDIVHAFSVGKEADYENLCTSLGLDKNNLVKPNQMHTDEIKIAQEKIETGRPDINIAEYIHTDGLITQKKNLILATTSADCILMLFFDPVTKTIAAIHSGWKGTYQEIGSKAVQKMQKECGVKPENIICCMCPSIRSCHFEVQEDVKNMFAEKFGDLKDTIIQKKSSEKGKWNIDTVLLNTIQLQKQGLKPQNIIDSKICTVCHSQILHSYRVEKEGFGLETAVIMRK